MTQKWTGTLIGKMHNANITRKDLADKLGVGKPYVTMILNGQRNPKNAKELLTTAFEEIVKEREVENAET